MKEIRHALFKIGERNKTYTFDRCKRKHGNKKNLVVLRGFEIIRHTLVCVKPFLKFQITILHKIKQKKK